ncbi:recombinase family protein [Nonomuraea sp. NPDC049129]|uniref:recombinase family protein n=1 Tax=Nonomuraea sp. NPDC049129 TaxID=3155272 RepID=UPI0034007D6B
MQREIEVLLDPHLEIVLGRSSPSDRPRTFREVALRRSCSAAETAEPGVRELMTSDHFIEGVFRKGILQRQDVAIQTEQLLAVGVAEERIYIDRGFSGTTRRNRAGLDQALAATWDGTVFTVTKFDRFARNMAEANEILTDLSGRGVLFGLGGSVYDWNDPFGRLFLQTLAMVAEFEANIGHQRTREGMALAKKNGKLKGKQSKLPEPARRSIRRRYAEGEVSLADLALEYSLGRSTIHRIIHGAEPPSRTREQRLTAARGGEDLRPSQALATCHRRLARRGDRPDRRDRRNMDGARDT